jgi:tetratricopeptide (TPR) repeat protein
MVAVATLPLVLALLLALAGAPAGAQDALQAMRDLIQRGYWHSAAQLNGPNLIAQYPDDSEAHLLYATALYLTGDVAGAAERLAVATALVRRRRARQPRAPRGPDPRRPGGSRRRGPAAPERLPPQPVVRLRHGLGAGRVAGGDDDEAIAAFEAAAATPEGSREAWPHLSRGRVLAALGRWSEAIAAYRTALDVYEAHDPGGPRLPGPVYVEAWFRLGEAHEALGQLREAEAAYRAARSVDPNHAPAVQAVDRLARRGE